MEGEKEFIDVPTSFMWGLSEERLNEAMLYHRGEYDGNNTV